DCLGRHDAGKNRRQAGSHSAEAPRSGRDIGTRRKPGIVALTAGYHHLKINRFGRYSTKRFGSSRMGIRRSRLRKGAPSGAGPATAMTSLPDRVEGPFFKGPFVTLEEISRGLRG